MRKFISLFAALALMALMLSCEAENPTQPKLNVTQNQLLLNKYVAIGNSLTAGFQSSGMAEDFQMHSFPYFIARQIGQGSSFQQPLIAAPGIGSTPGKTPLKLQNGNLVADDLTVDPLTLLKNALLPRPYDNLGVPGAALADVMNATNATSAAGGPNPFFDMVLRNPNFGNTTMLQQAILLNPTLITLWIGNNDVLGAALDGGNLDLITPSDDFKANFTALLTALRQNTKAGIVMANIPYVTDIPFVNMLDIVFATSPTIGITEPAPMIFGPDLQPVDFSLVGKTGFFLPLLTEETGVVHVTLPALSAYQQGLGVPDSAALVNMGLIPQIASGIIAGLKGAGLTPTGLPLPGNLTLTADEAATIKDAVDEFNNIIATLAAQFQVPLVDANSMLTQLNASGLDGYTGRFVLIDPVNTAFSLDGVHPNNGGYAIVANAFIDKINQSFGLSIAKVDVSAYKGQYAGMPIAKLTQQALEQVKAIF